MREAARSGRRRWALGNWDLRWKVTAVLAVPLAVAVGLGVSRISSEFTNSGRLADVAENVGAIPAVTALSAQTATTVGSQMIAIAPNVSVVTDQNLADLDKAIANAEKAADKLSGVPGARAALDSMLNQAKAVRQQGKAVSTGPSSDAIGLIDRVRNDSVRIVETTVGQVSDTAVDTAKLRLVDSLNTRATLVGEVAAFPEVLKDPKAGTPGFLTAANTERSLLNVLSHRFPDGDTSIADLRAGIDTRVALLNSPQSQAGQIPVGDLKKSLTDSLAVYELVVSRATKDIDSAMNSLVSTAQRDAWTYTAVVIATILAALLLAVFVARSMIVPLHRLRLAALRVAESDLPHEVAQLRNGASPEEVPLEPMPVRSTEEIGQLARAVDDIHGQALRLASDQAQMRSQVNDMFETLARRSKSLVDHQLSLIEAMEYDEKDPRLLENLFRLDHLAARMRRNGDNLLILAGTRQRRAKSAPVEIADVLRAAISEVEDYERVKLGATPRGSLVEPAASDMAHLFAELLDNALRASPPETDVKFTFAQAHDQGMLIEVADRGIGMPPAEMADINRRLEQTAEPGPDTARHMGLFVVGRLAERHGLTVRLRPTFDTARDPGVTVTVHVPGNLIVAGKPITAQPVTPSPSALERQRPSAASSMQMRAITRTPGGNVMVTVDPGVSGPIPIGTPNATGSGPIPAGGPLPQRQPGNTMSSGLQSNAQQASPTLRPAPGQQSTGPQRGKLAAANLPKRTLTPGGPPPRQPGGPVEPTVTGLPPRDANSGELPQRQPGSNGVPQPSISGLAQPPSGLPQRQPGSNGVPQRDSTPGGLPQREPSAGGLPQRESGSSGLPQRQPGANGLPQREGLPQRDPNAGGLPQRDPSAAELPQRESGASGLPQREPGAGGLPQRDPAAGGLPRRQRGENGMPQRESASGGLPQRESGGLPQREPTVGGLPQRDSSLPQREPSSGSLPGLPQREPAAGGLPQREPGGLPQRDPAAGGLPQRDSAAGGLPQRDPSAGGLPQRDPSASGLPQREPSAGGLPQRDSILPQRDPSTGGLPQRDSILPQRDPNAGGLPQRHAASASLPQRDVTPTGLPQRQPGSQVPPNLPQREPGDGLPKRETPPGLSLSQRSRGTLPGGDEQSTDTEAAGADPGRHSYRANPSRTASFFQTRLQPAVETGDSVMGGTPIFAEMMSAWLSDPNMDRSQVAASFESPGDEGWQAARRASEAQSETRTAAGLPQRNPGGRLVPGAVNGAVERAPSRDPETIRSSLSRHQQGVRDGRAMRAMNLTGDKGDR
ncbi:signal transduction histidine kinase [Nocardia tenerifensis]|uniref:histidine kinase n=2 Tax=Nocardia tenerifensis TaxID=228006 RepID=A0A318KAC6_9NOCA|nr:sensor histidine kinase [Nocardia tenerifensis]PXX66755.1 signal transduction histidine kinase [Nocardia tenerifensis]